jgi:hypothetical protein
LRRLLVASKPERFVAVESLVHDTPPFYELPRGRGAEYTHARVVTATVGCGLPVEGHVSPGGWACAA